MGAICISQIIADYEAEVGLITVAQIDQVLDAWDKCGADYSKCSWRVIGRPIVGEGMFSYHNGVLSRVDPNSMVTMPAENGDLEEVRDCIRKGCFEIGIWGKSWSHRVQHQPLMLAYKATGRWKPFEYTFKLPD